jgi:PKD repeat protein
VISGNSITDNQDSGIYLSATDAVVNDNRLDSNQNGVLIFNSISNLVFTGNTLRNNTGAALYLDNTSAGSNGSIYNNYFGNLKVIAGEENASKFLWTNPAGPQPGTSIVGGPFIAGNYWSNTTGTGWSDQQPPNAMGYTTIPYEVTPGTYDTAPLVKTGIIPTPTPTPTPTPGSLVAIFTADPVIGVPPLSVRFIDLSIGSPTTWRWNFGDGSYSFEQNPSHSYNGIGRYTITLEVGNPDARSIVRKIEFIKTVRYLQT